jgi:hypothetical protein
METITCDNCKKIEKAIIDAYNINEQYKDALNIIIEKNNIILEQNKIIEELNQELKKIK